MLERERKREREIERESAMCACVYVCVTTVVYISQCLYSYMCSQSAAIVCESEYTVV